ncbi:MAG: cytochrome b [Alphaproteobacteria bacterium]|nr:cytochrome b [Alphaproteobacteria bacterium]
MGSGQRESFDNPVIEWVDERLPIFTLLHKEYGVFPTPKNFNYFWNFGAIAMFMLMAMIATGIVLAMHYTADTELAFDSVERIMRDVNGGWLIRYIHMNGASFFFIAVYIHMFRGMYYGSYKKPRELLWMLGVVIFLLMMATAFIGYVLPWGQMSLWGATVITNLFSAIPFVGDYIVTLLWGGFAIDNPTLTRFFALHYLLPFVIFAVVFLHIWALHVTGSNNPIGIEPQSEKDTLPFHPYYTMKDTFGLVVFLIIYALFIFYMPDALGHPDNYIPADPLVTPAHIVPEWYFLPFYAILRAVTFNMNVYMVGGLAFMFIFMTQFVWCDKAKFSKAGGVALFVVASGLIVFGLIGDLYQGLGIPMTAAETAPISAKLGGVIAMFGSIILLFFLPWLDWHPLKSARFRPLFRISVILLALSVVCLGYAGSQPADKVYWVKCIGESHACEAVIHGEEFNTTHGRSPTVIKLDNTMLAQAFTGFYFFFFLVLLPLLSRYEKGRELPPSIHQAVLDKQRKAGA